MNTIQQETFEARRPPPNRPAGSSLLGRLRFAGRRFLDLQVHTVVRDIAPWLEARRGALLEVGCGDQPYRHLLAKTCKYVGLDFAGSQTLFDMTASREIVYFDGGRFPFADAEFDSVLHTEVLEHVKDVDFFLSECRRVLRPGGELLFTVPFQARFHFIPFDYWRFTPSGLETILDRAGFVEAQIGPRGTDVTVAAYKCVSVFYRLAVGGLGGKCLFVLFCWLVGLLLLLAHLSLLLRLGSADDCLGYTVQARRR